MPKQQAKLDAFFGANASKKKQQTLTSMFLKQSTKAQQKMEKSSALCDTDDDDEGEVLTATKRSNNDEKKTEPNKRPRRAIVDDDDDDDDGDDGSDNEKTKETEKMVVDKKEEEEEEKKEEKDTKINNQKRNNKINKTEIPTKATAKNSKNASTSNDDDDDESTTQGNTDTTPERDELIKEAKKLVKALGVTSDAELLKTASEKGAPVGYVSLVKAFEQIEAITGRLEIQGILTRLFRQVLMSNPNDMYSMVYLASNSVAPAYECVELGIGDSILIKAIGEAYGTNPSKVKEKYEKEGDLGTVAQTYKSKQRTLMFGAKPKPLTTAHVLQVLREVAAISGSQSQKLKVDKIKKLLVRVQESAETKYIIRSLQGKLRIGLAQSTVLISLAHAFALTIPETATGTKLQGEDTDEAKQFCDLSLPVEKRMEAAVAIVKRVYSEVPSYDALLDAALKVPLTELSKACSFQPGIPVSPMLAKPTKSIQEVLKRLNGLAFTCEFKYDGERAQIHKCPDGTLKVFSRNLLDTTAKYPEVPLFVQEAADDTVESFVLDAEVVAFNKKTGQLVPFQILSTRKKSEESAETAKVQVIVQAFDLMYLNGKSLLNSQLKERRELMHKHFQAVEDKFQFAKSLDFVEDGDTTALEQFLDTAVKGQCEGLMVKTLDDVYEPSRRSLNWLKLKKDYLDGLGDSFDLVPLGAYHGRGKRTGVYGAYLLACYDKETEEFQSVCKIGTGFSDEDLKTLSENLNQHKLEQKSSQYNVAEVLDCDVWFDAVEVWEIKAADLSKSSTHRGAEGKTGEVGRGIGLRFPRFERIRTDKKPEQATTSDQVLEMYYNQDTVNGDDDGGDDDGI